MQYDAVLLIAFGGPEKMDDVRPFLANVLRGRPVPPARLQEVIRHYELFDGRSPLNAITLRQAQALQRLLAQDGISLPVYVGMRNWHPYIAETLEQMGRDGVKKRSRLDSLRPAERGRLGALSDQRSRGRRKGRAARAARNLYPRLA